LREEKAFYEALGRRIEQCRSAKHMSQEKLGDALSPKLTRAAISNIETAKQRVLAHVLVDIARVLSVKVGDLIETPPSQEAPASEPAAFKRSLEEASLPPEAVAMFTRRVDQQQRLTAKKTTKGKTA